MVQDRAIVTTADQLKVIHDLLNSTIFNHLERPRTHADFMARAFFDAEYLQNG